MRASLAILLLAGALPSVGAEPVAKAGGVELDAAAVQALLAAQPEALRMALAKEPSAFEQWVRTELVNRTLLAEARGAGFDSRPATVAALERLRTEALVRLWLQAKAEVPSGYPSDADLRTAYDQAKDSLRSAPEYHLAQLFVAAPDGVEPGRMAQALRKVTDLAPRLLPPADFARLARENSEQADSAANGGDQGWLREEQLLPAVQVAVRSLKVGEVAGPLKTAQGFHFVKLLELRPPRPLGFDEARVALVASLRARRGQELQQQYLQELGRRSPVTLNQIALDSLRGVLK